jgi:pimeloyl-ACP methyl ester carboxylesterase
MTEQESSAFLPPPSSLIPWFQRAGFDIQEFSANGVRTFAVVEGQREAFPVIFLHGVPGGAFMWEYVIAALGRKRFAIAPDFPGWGRSISHYATLPSPTPEWSREWLNGVLTAQHVDRFDLVAHGTGGWLALQMLAQEPARVRRLSLISPRLWSGRKEGLGARLGRIFERPQVWSADRVRKWLGDHAALTPESRKHSAHEFAHRGPSDPPVLIERSFHVRFDVYRRMLAHFHGVTQLIWGENDPAYSLQQSEELVSNLDHPDVHRIAHAGHFPMLDQPQTVTPILKELLED